MSIIQAFPVGAGGGTSDYTDLENKPQIAGVTLSGNKTLSELGIQPAEAGKGLSTEDYTTAEKTKLANIDLSNYVPNSEVGSAGGVAELDANGKVPVSQMPNGFDNIDNGIAGNVTSTVNGYTAESFTRTGESSPVAPADDTLYVDITLNVAFRWTGTQYISVGGGGVALGETSSTAYRGDRGKIAYEDSQANKTHIGDLSQLETTDKTDLVSAINEAAQSGGSITVDDALDATSDNAVKNKVIKAVVDEKVDKVTGKGLSTNDFTNEYKTQLDNLNVDLTNKQDKSLSASKSIEGANVTTVEGAVDALKTHTDRAVTDTNGAHGFKVTNSNNETKILYKSGDAWVEIPLGDKTQSSTLPQASESTVGMILQYTGADTSTLTNGYWYKCEAQGTSPETYAWVNKPVMEVEDLKKDTLPPASVDELGNIYLYTGTTTSELQKGFFYECIQDGQNYTWLNIRVQAGGGQTIQYTVMPTAEVATLGKVVQYTGATTTTEPIYKHNYWYECKAKTVEETTTYIWEPTMTQDIGDLRIGDEVTEIKVKYDDGYRPYISVDIFKCIGAFDGMELEEIFEIVDGYYNGEVSLDTIKDAWKVGDTKTIHINAVDSVAEQDVIMTIADFNHDVLTTAQGDKTKALMTLAFMLKEDTSWSGAYSSSSLNTWLNGTGLDIFPTDIKNNLKSVSKSVDGGFPNRYHGGITATINAKVFLPTCREVIGRDITNGEISGGDFYYKTGGGTRYGYHAISGARSKNILTSSGWAKSTQAPNWYTGAVCCTPANGAYCGNSGGFMPHFCI